MNAIKSPLLASSRMNWQTPENVLDAVREFDTIGLDPACGLHDLVKAKFSWHGLMPHEDGLQLSWAGYGLCWLNPPYGRAVARWVEKARHEAIYSCAEIIMLVAARPDTIWFQGCGAQRICFWRGRITFVGADDPAPFPSALLYYGLRGARFEAVFRKYGKVVSW